MRTACRHRLKQLTLFATPRPATTTATTAHLPLNDLLPLLQTLLEGVVVTTRQADDAAAASGQNERAP